MSKKLKSGIAAPITLKPFNKEDDSTVHVVIETPKGCQNKYKFDPVLRSFRLNRVLPSGMAFPYDFGFVPSSQADDGDPADVLLLMDYPVFPGCGVESRIIGVIEGEQEAEGNNSNRSSLDDTGRGGAVDLCLGCKLYGAQVQASGALGIASITSFVDGCSGGFVVTCIELTDDCRSEYVGIETGQVVRICDPI